MCMKGGRRDLWILEDTACGKDTSWAFGSWQSPFRSKWNFLCISNNAYICLKEKIKKVWKAADTESWRGRKGVLCPGHWGNCSKPVHPYAETVPASWPASAAARAGAGCGVGSARDGGVGTQSWLQQETWALGISQGLALKMGRKTNKQVCSKACRRNYISFGRTPLPPQGRKHPVRERKLPVNGRKLNGRTASAEFLFAFCQRKKRSKKEKRKEIVSRFIRPKRGSTSGNQSL